MGKLIIARRYGQTPNHILNNKELSLKAKGMFAFLQSKPEDWKFSAERIAGQLKEGLTSVKSVLKELEEFGLLERKPAKKVNGKWNGYDYTLYEEKQQSGNRWTENHPTETQPTVNLPNISNKDNSNKDIVINSYTTEQSSDEVNALIDIFYNSVNPTINYGNKTTRKAAEWLINKWGFERVSLMAEYACSVHGKEYAPTITTPYQLKEKLSSLKAYKEKQDNSKQTLRSL